MVISHGGIPKKKHPQKNKSKKRDGFQYHAGCLQGILIYNSVYEIILHKTG